MAAKVVQKFILHLIYIEIFSFRPVFRRLAARFALFLLLVLTALRRGVTLWLFYLIVRLFISVRRGEIFVSRVARYLETTGWLLVVLYVSQYLIAYISAKHLMHYLVLADYAVVFQNNCNNMYIFTGLALMIVSQIILMGRDLKDDQALTI